jgi:hypothetical protein
MTVSEDSALEAKQKSASFRLTVIGYPHVSASSEKTIDALRTYATWLVRATRRKMAAYEPENVPKKSPN